jgi:hypothetical protein
LVGETQEHQIEKTDAKENQTVAPKIHCKSPPIVPQIAQEINIKHHSAQKDESGQHCAQCDAKAITAECIEASKSAEITATDQPHCEEDHISADTDEQ